MKKVLFILMLSMAAISCKKKEADPPAAPPAGTSYVVKYTFTTNSTASTFTASYKNSSGSTVTVNNISSGWTVSIAASTGAYVSCIVTSNVAYASLLITIYYDTTILTSDYNAGSPVSGASVYAHGILP